MIRIQIISKERVFNSFNPSATVSMKMLLIAAVCLRNEAGSVTSPIIMVQLYHNGPIKFISLFSGAVEPKCPTAVFSIKNLANGAILRL